MSSSPEQAKASTERVPSPCIAICSIDPISGFCEGCLRNIQEIGAWRRMSSEEKRGVLAALPERKITAGAHE